MGTTPRGSPRHLGRADACAIDKIEVRWADASATVQTFPNVVSNYRIEINEGSDKLGYRPEP